MSVKIECLQKFVRLTLVVHWQFPAWWWDGTSDHSLLPEASKEHHNKLAMSKLNKSDMGKVTVKSHKRKSILQITHLHHINFKRFQS